MTILQMPLKHYNSRRGRPIDAIILHYPAPNLAHKHPYSVDAIHQSLNKHKLSYHYYITQNGHVVQFVPNEKRAWHAGRGSLHGEDDPNTYSIGVCLQNNGGEPYTLRQMQALAKLCSSLCKQHSIPFNRIVGHEHVSPKRKQDPGGHFNWVWFFDLLSSQYTYN